MKSDDFDAFVGVGGNATSNENDGSGSNSVLVNSGGGGQSHSSQNNDGDTGGLLDIMIDASSATAIEDADGGAPLEIENTDSSTDTMPMEIFGGRPGDGINCTHLVVNGSSFNSHGQPSITEQDVLALFGGAASVGGVQAYNDDAQQQRDDAAEEVESYNLHNHINNNSNSNSYDESVDDDYDSKNDDGDLIDMVGWDLRLQRLDDDDADDCASPSFGVDKNTPALDVNSKAERERNITTINTSKGNGVRRGGLFGGWRSDRLPKAADVGGVNDTTPISLSATSLSSSLSTPPSWSNVSDTASKLPTTTSNSRGGGFFRSRSNNASSTSSIPPPKAFHVGDASYLRVPCDGIDEAALAYGEGGITGDTIDHHRNAYNDDGEGDVSEENGEEEEEDHDNRLRPGDHVFVWQTYGINPRAYQRHAVVFSVTKRLDGEYATEEEDEGGISFDIDTLYSDQKEGKDIEVTVVSFYHFQQHHASHGAARAKQAASGDSRGKRSGCRRESLEEFIGQDGMKKQKALHKVRYGRKVKRGLLSQKAGVGTALKKDEVGLILARVQYLLDHPDHLPDHSALSANGECASLWCLTGRWCSLQGASILAVTSVGQAGGALLAGGILSNLTVLVPMPGVWGMAGWFWYVPATVAYPFLVPMLVTLGMASLVPLEILRRNRKKWRGITDGLNHQFWSDTSDAVKEEYFGVMATADKQSELRSFFGVRDGDVSTTDDARYMPVGGMPGGPDVSDDDEDEALAIQQMEASCQNIAADMNVDLSGRPPSKERPKGSGGWGSFIGSMKKKDSGTSDGSMETERFRTPY